MGNFEVVTIGSAVLDVAVKSKDFKVMKSHEIEGGVGLCEVYGGKTEVDSMEVAVGGGGTNTAVSLGVKGVRVGCIAKIAADDVGEMIKRRLKGWGMDLRMLIESESGHSAMSTVLVAPDGGRSILTYRGVSKEIKSKEINWKRVKKSDWIMVTSLGGDMALMEDVVFFARKNEIKVFWNPGKNELAKASRLREIAQKVDVLVMNRMEFAELMGVSFEDQLEIDRGAVGYGPGYLVITEGRRGSVVYKDDRKVKVEAFKSDSKDETGAGDAYSSGLLYGLYKGWDFGKAMKAGAANAAGVVKKIGAKNGLLDEKEMSKWIEKDLQVVEERY